MKISKKIVVPYMLSGIIAAALLAKNPTTAGNQHGDYSIDSVKPLSIENIIDKDTVVWEEITPHAIKAYQENKDVLYIMNTGDTIRRVGGTLAWRNNNPGNLAYGEFARENGAIGKGPRKFAVFPDEATGRAALSALLRSEKYNKLTIANAIVKYAPPVENDVALYHNRLRKMTGLNLDTRICDLDSAQMAKVTDAICVIEGWRAGRIVERPATDRLMAMENVRTQMLRDSTQRTM